MTDRTTAYARAVVARRIVTNTLVRQACRRHLDDLRHGKARGLRWDVVEAERAIDLIGAMPLPSGEPFVVQPSQAFIVGSLWGWRTSDGGRRFRTAYIEEGKGNGKTPLAARIGIVGLAADGVAAAEVYTAGVTRDQAQYLWRDGRLVVEASPALRDLIEIGAHNLAVPATDSFMRPVSSEARSLDQKRVHMALIDEVHEHETDLVVEKMRAGTKGDETALIVEITNSGYDRHSICWRHHEYSRAVLDGTTPNDAWFAFVCGLDDGDDWMNDESCWVKANPLLDLTISRRYLREQVQEARDMPAKAALVARLNFCVWTEASSAAIDLERWDACAAPPAIPDGATVYAGLDLSSTTDLAALVLAWADRDGTVHLEPHVWCPESAVEARSRRDRVPYDQWVRSGHLVATPGDVTDYPRIFADLMAISARVRIAECAYVRLNATQFVIAAAELTTMVPVGQTYTAVSEPTKDFLGRIVAGTIRHGGHPVLRWMAANLVVDDSPDGDLRPSREHSTERITAMSAAILALSRLTAPHEPESPEPGLLAYYRSLAGDHAPAPAPSPVSPALPCGSLYRAGATIATCDAPAGHPGLHGAPSP